MTADAMPPNTAHAAMYPSWLMFESNNSTDNVAKNAPKALPNSIAPNLSDLTITPSIPAFGASTNADAEYGPYL
jgi:hypothetical protein